MSVNALFHPKRNQARQKLATLPGSRFRELATDVFGEIGRRHNLSKVGRQQEEEELAAEEDELKTAVAAPTIELPNLGEYHPSKTPGNTGTQQPQSSAAPLSAVNFAHLDSLMADLGSMFDNQQNGQMRQIESNTQSRRPSNNNILQPVPEQKEPIRQQRPSIDTSTKLSKSNTNNNELESAKSQLVLLKQKNKDLEEQVSIQIKVSLLFLLLMRDADKFIRRHRRKIAPSPICKPPSKGCRVI